MHMQLKDWNPSYFPSQTAPQKVQRSISCKQILFLIKTTTNECKLCLPNAFFSLFLISNLFSFRLDVLDRIERVDNTKRHLKVLQGPISLPFLALVVPWGNLFKPKYAIICLYICEWVLLAHKNYCRKHKMGPSYLENMVVRNSKLHTIKRISCYILEF